jgi:hypothetical protein
LADSLAVKGRNRQAAEVVIQLLFRPIIHGEEKLLGIPRFSVSPHANIYDFWPALGTSLEEKSENQKTMRSGMNDHRFKGR